MEADFEKKGQDVTCLKCKSSFNTSEILRPFMERGEAMAGAKELEKVIIGHADGDCLKVA